MPTPGSAPLAHGAQPTASHLEFPAATGAHPAHAGPSSEAHEPDDSRAESLRRTLEGVEGVMAPHERVDQVEQVVRAIAGAPGHEGGGFGATTAINAVTSGAQMALGAHELQRGQTVRGAGDLASGAGGALNTIGQLAPGAARLTEVAPLISGTGDILSSAADIHDHGANGDNVTTMTRGALGLGGGLAALNGVPGAAPVTASLTGGMQVGHALHDQANAGAVRRGDYGVHHVTQRGYHPDGNYGNVNADVDDDAALQGGRQYLRDLHAGHGDLYSNADGARVAIQTGVANTAHSLRNNAIDAAYGGGQPSARGAAAARALGVDHVYSPAELASMPEIGPDTPPEEIRRLTGGH